jgi:GNAT superfamily N-acetyltransferase
MSGTLELRKLTTVADMLPHWRLITQLTAGLTQEAYARMLPEMVAHNYFQVVVGTHGEAIAVSGYWIGHKLYCGKYLEIDNFVVDEAHRSSGVGSLVLEWLEREAHREGCALLMLDAYVENFKAHRFYYRHGFHARGFHYLKHLRGWRS